MNDVVLGDIRKLEDKLYGFNSQIVSLRWIGLKTNPTEKEIEFLNKMLGETIKLLRRLRE